MLCFPLFLLLVTANLSSFVFNNLSCLHVYLSVNATRHADNNTCCRVACFYFLSFCFCLFFFFNFCCTGTWPRRMVGPRHTRVWKIGGLCRTSYTDLRRIFVGIPVYFKSRYRSKLAIFVPFQPTSPLFHSYCLNIPTLFFYYLFVPSHLFCPILVLLSYQSYVSTAVNYTNDDSISFTACFAFNFLPVLILTLSFHNMSCRFTFIK